MASPEEDNDLDQKLLQVTNNLLHPPSTTDEIILLLREVELCLTLVEHASTGHAQAAVAPLLAALIGDELLRHADVDVKVAVASCISEITRISAPDAPLDDDPMKEAFQLIVSSFENLHDMSSRSYEKRIEILETVSKVRSCVLMLDLECDDLILEMFQHFLKEIREHHAEHVFLCMQNIMTVVLEESEDISPNLLSLFLDSIKKENEDVSPIAKKLVENVVESCATKLKPYLVQAVNTLGISMNDYSNVLASICHDGSGSLEQNDGSTTSEHAGDGSKSVKEPLEESAAVIGEDAKEAAPPQEDNSSAPPLQDNRLGNHSPKSGTNNGNPQAAEDGILLDSKSPEKQETTNFTVQSKGIHFSANEDPTNLDTEKVDDSDQKQDQSSKRRARKTTSSTKSAEPSEGSYPANVKEYEKVIDSGSHSKDYEKVIVSESHSKEYEKVIASESNSKEDEKVIDSESHSKEDEKLVDSDSHSHSKEDNNSDQKQGESRKKRDDNSDKKQGDATMKRGSHPIALTKLAEPPKDADPANVKEVEKVIDAESHGKKDDNNDQKQGQVTKKRGKRKPISSTKLAEPPKGSYPANVKEDDKMIESESHGKKDDNNVRKHGQVTKKRGKRKPISSTKSAEPPKESYPANVKEDEKVVDSEIYSKEDDDSDQKQGPANKKGGRQSSSSIKSAANVQEDVKVIDSESHSKEVPSSPYEDDSVKASGLSESDEEIDTKISSLKAGGVSDPVASPSPRVSFHGENRSKNLGRSKKKDSSAKKVVRKDVSEKVYEETSDSEAKPTKRSVKKERGSTSVVEKNILVNSVKKGNGTATEPDAKKHSDKNTEAGSKGGGGSGKKKQGPGKANSETGAAKSSVKNVDKEMVSLSKSATKSIEDSEELPKANLKRKHTPGKENESGIKKYGENLVGTRVKVWWPDDDMFYKGVVEYFFPSKKMHQVTYDDGDIEILNLRNETWEIITGGADSDMEEGADHPSPDAPADIPPKKKSKTSASESRKGGNKDASISAGGATSSKSRRKSIKSSHRSEDGSKSKVPKITVTESDDEVVIMKTKNHTPKSGGIGKFIDAAARKMSSSKSDDTDKDDVVSTPKLSGKAKQETPKTGKLKQEKTSKTAAASSKAAKSTKSGGGKSNSNGTSKVKFKLLEDSDDDNDSEDSENEVVEDTKAKKSSSLKGGGGGSEVKIGKKRARS